MHINRPCSRAREPADGTSARRAGGFAAATTARPPAWLRAAGVVGRIGAVRLSSGADVERARFCDQRRSLTPARFTDRDLARDQLFECRTGIGSAQLQKARGTLLPR